MAVLTLEARACLAAGAWEAAPLARFGGRPFGGQGGTAELVLASTCISVGLRTVTLAGSAAGCVLDELASLMRR